MKRKRRLSPEVKKVLDAARDRVEQLYAELNTDPANANESATEFVRQFFPKDMQQFFPKGMMERADVVAIVRRARDEWTRNRYLVRLISAEMRASEQAVEIADAERTARARPIAGANLRRRQDAQTEHEKWRDIARKLYEQRPELKRASRNRLAAEVQSVLVRRGTRRSVRQIRRALFSK